MKKWSTILSDEETVEIGGIERKLKIKECMESFDKLPDLQRSLMYYEKDNALHVISDILV